MFTAIRQWVIQTMMKGQTGVMRTLPKRDIIEMNTQITAERIMRQGIDPNALKNVNQVENVINQIDTPKVIPADSAEGKGITEQLFGKKKADVLDMEGNKIPEGSQIMGGKEVPTSIESDAAIKARLDGDNKKSIAGIKISLVDDSIAKIKSLEPMDAMKEANLVAGKKGRYANLDDNQVKKIMDDTEDHIFERDIPDEDFATGGRVGLSKGGGLLKLLSFFNKKSPYKAGKDYLTDIKNKTLKAKETGKFMDLPLAEVGIPATTGALVTNQVKKKLEAMNEEQKELDLKEFIEELENDQFYQKYPDLKDETIASYTEKLFGEKKADGGRIGLSGGGGLLKLFKFLKPKPKKLTNTVNEFISKRKFLKSMVGETEKNKKARELKMLKDSMEEARKNPGFKFENVDIDKDIRPIFDKELAETLKKNRKLNADGGRIGLKKGSGGITSKIVNALGGKNMTAGELGLEGLNQLYQLLQMPGLYADGGRIGYKDGPKFDVQASGKKTGKNKITGAPDGITIDNESINAIIKADIPISQKIDLIAEYKYGKDRDRIDYKDQEIFLGEGGYKDRDIGFGYNLGGDGISGSVMRDLRTGDDDFKIRFKKSFADGGRIGLKGGSGRRDFLKLIASLMGSTAAAKSGIFTGLGKGAGKTVAKEVAQQTTSSMPPPYFFKLVEKIKTMGDDVTVSSSTMPRQKVTQYKDYELTEDVATGSKEIKKIGIEDDMITKNEYMTYTKGQADETTKSKKPADEYEEVTESNSRIYKDEFNEPNYEDGIELNEILKEVGETVTKKADGGLIGNASGGIARMLGE